jgi:hypothetical protein
VVVGLGPVLPAAVLSEARAGAGVGFP